MRANWLLGLALGACTTESFGESFVEDPADGAWLDGKQDGASAVDVRATHLEIHLSNHTGVATIDLEHDGNVELEADGLTISTVHDDRGNRHYTRTTPVSFGSRTCAVRSSSTTPSPCTRGPTASLPVARP